MLGCLPRACFRSASDVATSILRSEKRSERRSSAAETAASRSSTSITYKSDDIVVRYSREQRSHSPRGRSDAPLVVRVPATFVERFQSNVRKHWRENCVRKCSDL